VLQRLTSPLSRLPMSLVESTTRLQRVGIPIYGPSPPTHGASETLVTTGALYAGESALRIDAVVPASEAVSLLVGTDQSPTMRST
jgi:nitronate monooxygenase